MARERFGQEAGKSSNKSPSTPFRLGGLCHFVMLCFLPRLQMCSWIHRQCRRCVWVRDTATNRGFDTCRLEKGGGRRRAHTLNGFLSPAIAFSLKPHSFLPPAPAPLYCLGRRRGESLTEVIGRFVMKYFCPWWLSFDSCLGTNLNSFQFSLSSQTGSKERQSWWDCE